MPGSTKPPFPEEHATDTEANTVLSMVVPSKSIFIAAIIIVVVVVVVVIAVTIVVVFVNFIIIIAYFYS